MKKRILEYRNRIDNLLQNPPDDADWDAILEEHLVQIGFFQHERLVHLIVMITFALLQAISLFMLLMCFSWGILGLFLLILVLLIPYIGHYYLLENETQKMYEQYDEMLKYKNGA